MIDIDQAELHKPTVHVDVRIWADTKDFLQKVNTFAGDETVFAGESWREQCRRWKQKYPVTHERHWEENGSTANVYAFIRQLSSVLPQESLTAVSNGACCVAGHQNWVIKKGTRFIINNGIASIRTAGGDRALCRRRTKGNSLPGGGWKHYDEPSGAADDRYESSPDQAVFDQQSGVSQYSPDTGESVS